MHNGISPAAVALGANLGASAQTITAVVKHLEILPDTELIKHSALYQSEAVGPPQPAYVNAAVLLNTAIKPLALLDALLEIESSFGRRRDGTRWGARTLDLDIIVYGTLCMRHERLTLPHPEAHHRCFVLAPLAEIAPQMIIPGHGAVAELLLRCDTGEAVKISDLKV